MDKNPKSKATMRRRRFSGALAFTRKNYIHEIQSEKDWTATVMEDILDNLKPKAKETPEKMKGQA